jgi:hypothetical protein
MMALCAALLVSLPTATVGQRDPGAGRLSPADVAAWREDLRVLASELPRRHPMVFEGLTPTKLTRASFDSAVRDLEGRIPSLQRHQVAAGFQRIVAMVGAGHTSINPGFEPKLGYRYYPLRLEAFADGIFVVAADTAHRGLVGARVERIGRLSAEAALDSIAPFVSHENREFLRSYGMFALMIPELLHAAGITPDPHRVQLSLERDGRSTTATLRPAGPIRMGGHGLQAPIDETGWVNMRPAGTAQPLYLSREEPRWVEYRAETKTLYVAYQSSVPAREGESIPAFLTRVFALADSVRPDRFVLDVRNNSGGESFFNRQLVLGIIRRPALDRRGAFFTVIGRRTYSAAQNLVNELERYTNVTFIGEPTGSPPAFFGDHDRLILPRSGIGVNISTLWWSAPLNPRDRRLFTAPRWFAEPTAADFVAGRDPVLESIDRWLAAPTLTAELTAALASPDTGLGARRLAEYRGRAENRYADVEAEVNALGYASLRAGDSARAIRVFEMNVAAHPRSANAHDSLGEAYERLGRRADAIRAYRGALAIDQRFGSSRDGLRRLGAAEPAGAGHEAGAGG